MVGETGDYCGMKDLTENIYTDGEKFYLIAKEADTTPLIGRINMGEVVVELSEEALNQIKKLEQLSQLTPPKSSQHPFGEWAKEPLPFKKPRRT